MSPRARYPKRIEAILEEGETLPRLFAGGWNGSYRSSDRGFEFWVRSSSSYRHFGFVLDSVRRQWTELEEPFSWSATPR